MSTRKVILPIFIALQVLCLNPGPVIADVTTKECSSDKSAKVCQTQRVKRDKNAPVGEPTTGTNKSDSEYTSQQSNSEPSTYTTKGANGLTLIRSKSDSNILGCVGKGGKIGHVKLNNLIVRDDGTYIDGGLGKHSPTSETCVPNDTRTLTSADSPGPTGPTYEEVMEEIRHAAESLEPGKPTLHQSYNNPTGTGRAEGDPNVHKGDQINFYVNDGGPYRLEADMLAGHVEIELMPSSYSSSTATATRQPTTPLVNLPSPTLANVHAERIPATLTSVLATFTRTRPCTTLLVSVWMVVRGK